MPIRLHGLKAWFLVSGGIGTIVALVLALISANHPLNPKLLLTLWPASIVGLADPWTLAGKILIGLYEFGGNFLVYAVAGTVLGFAIRLRKKPGQQALSFNRK